MDRLGRTKRNTWKITKGNNENDDNIDVMCVASAVFDELFSA